MTDQMLASQLAELISNAAADHGTHDYDGQAAAVLTWLDKHDLLACGPATVQHPTPPDAATTDRRPWHQVAPLGDDPTGHQAIAHFGARAYAELLALAVQGAPKHHARDFEAAYTAVAALHGRTWPDIHHALSDGERAAEDLHALLRQLNIDPDTIAPAETPPAPDAPARATYPPDTEWMPIGIQIYGNAERWETVHHAGPRCLTPMAAFVAGFQDANDTDDFLIAAVSGDRMIDLTGSDLEPLDAWEADDYQQVADGVGLHWAGW